MPDEVIVVTKYEKQFRWYRSDREYWILDQLKWIKAFEAAGYEVPEGDFSERFGMPIISDEKIWEFLQHMQRFQVDNCELANELELRFPDANSWWDVGDLFPIMFVDFDRRHVAAFYPEGVRMEKYLPDGWSGEFEDFAATYDEDRFPKREKFWIRDDVDLLVVLNQRGARKNS